MSHFLQKPLFRRTFLAQAGAGLGVMALGRFAHALNSRSLQFPADHGSHNDFQTEWWYLTGWLGEQTAPRYGFQITFFRSRIAAAQNLQSPLAAKHLVLAHAAISDVQGKTLLHDDRVGRFNGAFDAATQIGTSSASPHARIRDWALQRLENGNYTGKVQAKGFGLELTATPTQRLLLQGNAGLSRKGPQPSQASFYYSQPQLQVTALVQLKGGKPQNLSGKAWLDHEWSQEIMHPEAVGWDWIGMNLFDGASLTAFQLRKKDGTALWTGGSFRGQAGSALSFTNGQATFAALPGEQHRFRSPKTNAVYPTAWALRTPQGNFTVHALFPNQELDSTRSTQTVYWEGLSELRSAAGQTVGRGYLEMTGYDKPIRL